MIGLCEVGPRDGLQNEATVLAPGARAQLVDRLAACGIGRIEAVSFVRDDLVPPMAGAEAVVAAITPRPGVVYAGLVLNERGLERLRHTTLREAHAVIACTESFNQRNANATTEEAFAGVAAIVAAARDVGLRATVTLSVAFGCPFEGAVAEARAVALAERVAALVPDEIVLADTIGVATPWQVRRVLAGVAGLGVPVGLHLHDTRNTAIANVYAALEAGVRSFDASVGGIGGCPFAPGASGNVATEDVVYLLEREGFPTGIDLDGLIGVARWVAELLGRALPGSVHRAGPALLDG